MDYTGVRKHRTIVLWALSGNDMVLFGKRSVIPHVLPAIFDWNVLPWAGNRFSFGKYLPCILVFAVSQCNTDCTWRTIIETIGGISDESCDLEESEVFMRYAAPYVWYSKR